MLRGPPAAAAASAPAAAVGATAAAAAIGATAATAGAIGPIIGPVRFVRAGSGLAGVDPTHPSFRAGQGGGALLNIGGYGAWLATEWLGPAQVVEASGRLGPTGVDVFAAVQTTHAGGGSAQTYCGLDVLGPGEALLCGPGGHATVHAPWWNPSSATVQPAAGGAPSLELRCPFLHGGLFHELDHFCALLRAGGTESGVVSHRRSREVMAVLDRAKASAFGCGCGGGGAVAGGGGGGGGGGGVGGGGGGGGGGRGGDGGGPAKGIVDIDGLYD